MKRCRYCGAYITAKRRRRFCSAEHAEANARHERRDRDAARRALLRGVSR